MLNVDMKHGDGFASLNIAESVTYIANLAEVSFPSGMPCSGGMS
jgi:hypothetical protein